MNSDLRKSPRRFRFVHLLAAMIVLATTSISHAGFVVNVYEDSSLIYSASSSGNTINLTTGTPDFNFTNVTVSTNSDTAALDGFAVLTVTGTVTYTGTSSGHTLSILSTDTRFNAPTGTSYSLYSSESFSAAGTTPPAGSYTFQSFADPADAEFGKTVPSLGYTFADISKSGSHDEDPVDFLTGGGYYSLTNQIDYHATVTNSEFNPTGSSFVLANAVPEPASMGLMGTGLIGMALVAKYRRKKAAAAR